MVAIGSLSVPEGQRLALTSRLATTAATQRHDGVPTTSQAVIINTAISGHAKTKISELFTAWKREDQNDTNNETNEI